MNTTRPLPSCSRNTLWCTDNRACKPLSLAKYFERPATHSQRNAEGNGAHTKKHADLRRFCTSAAHIEAVTEEGESSALQNFMGWLMANGVTGVGREDSKLGIFQAEGGERGVVFYQDAHDGEVLISIPMRLAITDYPGDLESNAALGSDSASDVRLAVKLLEQQRAGTGSPWFPFLQVLPEVVKSPYGHFPEAALQELQLAVDPRDVRHVLSHGNEGLPELGISPAELRWALSIVHSRSFQTAGKGGGLGVRMLMPLADMFNHAGDTANFLLSGPGTPLDNVRWELLPPKTGQGWTFVIRACRPVEAGEEAFFSYGPHSCWEFFLEGGFVPSRNSHAAVVLFPDAEAATQWYLDRFLPEGGVSEELRGRLLEGALLAADTAGVQLPAELASDATAAIHHSAFWITAQGELDGRMIGAFFFLLDNDKATVQQVSEASSSPRQEAVLQHFEDPAKSPNKPSRTDLSSSWRENDPFLAQPKAERLVGLRIAEMLFAPQVTSLLLDLQVLLSLESDDDEKEHLSALLKHYAQVVQRFEDECGALKALASNIVQDATAREAPRLDAKGLDANAFEEARVLLLRLRASQKQVLWNGLQAIFLQ